MSEPGPTIKPWLLLVADDDEDIHAVTRMAVRHHKFFGLPVELVSALSAREAEAAVADADATRFAVALIDVVMEHENAGLELVDRLRKRFGSPLQIIVRTGQPGIIASEEVVGRYEISNYITKHEALPNRLRTAIGLAIRNFRTYSAMRVLCDSLSSFAALFDAATTTSALDRMLEQALAQYALAWQFEYVFLPELNASLPLNDHEPWQQDALRQIQLLALHSHRSVAVSKLKTPVGAQETWGCVVRPLGGRFSAGFAFRQAEPPTEVLVRELQALLRGWVISRESLLMKQVANDEETIRNEMHRERRDAIAQMVAGLAHEVNTPLGIANAAAANLAELLSKERFKKLGADPSFQEDLDDIDQSIKLLHRNIARADELIQGFKRLSVRQLVDTREEVDLHQCVAECVKLFQPKAKRSGIELRVHDELDPKLRRWLGYPGHLSQILLNLLSNAERYAYPDGGGDRQPVVDVLVSSELVAEVPRFTVVVQDYGAGIPKENLPLVFEAFFTTGRGKGGSGLGLAIVHNLVTSVFGGTIACESTVGRGTTFVVRFSHCKEQEKAGAGVEAATDKVEFLQQYINLQQKLARNEPLTPDEQLQLSSVRQRVDGLVSTHFKGHDKRRAPRIPCSRAGVLLRDGRTDPIEIRDMSEVGALLWLSEPAQRGEQLVIQYSEAPHLILPSEVVTCVDMKTESMSNPVWQVGVKFGGLDATAQRNLSILLAQLTMEYWS